MTFLWRSSSRARARDPPIRTPSERRTRRTRLLPSTETAPRCVRQLSSGSAARPDSLIQYQRLIDFPCGLWCHDGADRNGGKNGSPRTSRSRLGCFSTRVSAQGLQEPLDTDDPGSAACCLCGVLFLGAAGTVAAQPAPGSGRLEGVVVRQDGSGVGGVLVLIEGTGQSELTDATGKYAFGRLEPATYTVLKTLGPQSVRQSGVVINPRATTTLRTVVDWPLTVFESVVVNGTTRTPERLVEAPAAATVVGNDELAAHALHGQLPRLLAGTPGAELVQSGLYDFNLNSRGFNGFYNRHVLTRIDGRDPSMPTVLGHVDWATLSNPLDDFDQLEFVRGHRRRGTRRSNREFGRPQWCANRLRP